MGMEDCGSVDATRKRRRASVVVDTHDVIEVHTQNHDVQEVLRAGASRDESMGIKKKGFLSKESKILKIWRKRWFVLTSTSLYAFKGKDVWNQSPTEEITLKEVMSVIGWDNGILRVETPERTLLLQAESDAERDEWIEAIADCCFPLFINGEDALSSPSRRSSRTSRRSSRRLSTFSIPETDHEGEDSDTDHEVEDTTVDENEEIHSSTSEDENAIENSRRTRSKSSAFDPGRTECSPSERQTSLTSEHCLSFCLNLTADTLF